MVPFWKSRKFWYMIVDVVVSISTFFVAKYVAPEASKDILFLIGALQPVVITLIASVAYEDGQEKRAGGSVLQLTESD
jgi:hypothetical protein